jgi:hypothetical protein
MYGFFLCCAHLSFDIMVGYVLHLEIVRAYSVYGDAVGAERVSSATLS